jgi:hypothetical protein
MGRTVVCAIAFAVSSYAQAASEMEEIREEIRNLREQYEKRIDALEERLRKAESQTKEADGNGKAESAARSAQSAPSGPTGESAYNPAISLILQGTYADFSEDPEGRAIGGFIPSGGEIFPESRGFSLAESELDVSANIDPYFRGLFTAALTPEDEIEIEEAWIQTLALGRGFTAKAGRFFSGIGYLNEIHQHAFDFVDFPLAYTAFLGGNYGDDGLQLKWLAPTDFFLEFGLEAGRGRSFPSSERNKSGTSSGAAFAHIGGDVGASHAYRAGLSYLKSGPRGREYEDLDRLGNSVVNAFSGDSRLWVADFVYKYAPGGNPRITNFKLQGEYFLRREDGELTFDSEGASSLGPLAGDYDSRQSGWYLQAVYQFVPRWRAGLRFDRLDSGSVDIALVDSGALIPADFALLAKNTPKRYTAMLDFSPSEFSRFRLQLARDESLPGESKDDQIFLQYIHSLGAHGAHRF